MRCVLSSLIALVLTLGCARKDCPRQVYCTDEAKELSKIIGLLGDSCTSRFDVASFCSNLQTVAKGVTNEQDRAELVDQYCRELLDLDLLGSPDNPDPMEIHGRCAVAKDFIYYSTATLKSLGASSYKTVEFAVAMCAHLGKERRKVQKAVQKQKEPSAVQASGGCYVPWSKCPKMVEEVRQMWIWQHIDMPKEKFGHIFDGIPAVEKEKLLKDIEKEIGRRPNTF